MRIGTRHAATCAARPNLPVHRCTNQVTKRVTPVAWPIFTIAETCFLCGFVFAYHDNVDAMQRYERETGRSTPPREFVVTHGIAHRTPADIAFDESERELASLIRKRIAPERIAHILNLPADYVRAHIALTRLRKPRREAIN